MGGLIDKVIGLFGKKEYRIVMVGLDGFYFLICSLYCLILDLPPFSSSPYRFYTAAGKTSILYKLKLNENVHTIPTIGFNMEEVQVKNIKFVVWDVGGQKKVCYEIDFFAIIIFDILSFLFKFLFELHYSDSSPVAPLLPKY